jgi:hypothetical protein
MKARFRALYNTAHEQGARDIRNELRAKFRDSATQKRIQELKDARRAKKIGAEEAGRRIDQILSGG